MQTINPATYKRLKIFAQAFRDARENDDPEATIVNLLVKLFDEVLGYSLLKGEITSQYAIKNRFCDLAVLLDNEVKLLIEVKRASSSLLTDRDIEQAENYASQDGLTWVLLSNGIEWKLFHLSFNKGTGIQHKEIFNFNFADNIDQNPEEVWNHLSLLTKKSISRKVLEDFYLHKKALSACSFVKALSAEKVLNRIRTEINRISKTRINLKDLIDGLNKLISDEAHNEGGNVVLKKGFHKTKNPPQLENSPIVGEQDKGIIDSSKSGPIANDTLSLHQ